MSILYAFISEIVDEAAANLGSMFTPEEIRNAKVQAFSKLVSRLTDFSEAGMSISPVVRDPTPRAVSPPTISPVPPPIETSKTRAAPPIPSANENDFDSDCNSDEDAPAEAAEVEVTSEKPANDFSDVDSEGEDEDIDNLISKASGIPPPPVAVDKVKVPRKSRAKAVAEDAERADGGGSSVAMGESTESTAPKKTTKKAKKSTPLIDNAERVLDEIISDSSLVTYCTVAITRGANKGWVCGNVNANGKTGVDARCESCVDIAINPLTKLVESKIKANRKATDNKVKTTVTQVPTEVAVDTPIAPSSGELANVKVPKEVATPPVKEIGLEKAPGIPAMRDSDSDDEEPEERVARKISKVVMSAKKYKESAVDSGVYYAIDDEGEIKFSSELYTGAFCVTDDGEAVLVGKISRSNVRRKTSREDIFKAVEYIDQDDSEIADTLSELGIKKYIHRMTEDVIELEEEEEE